MGFHVSHVADFSGLGEKLQAGISEMVKSGDGRGVAGGICR